MLIAMMGLKTRLSAILWRIHFLHFTGIFTMATPPNPTDTSSAPRPILSVPKPPKAPPIVHKGKQSTAGTAVQKGWSSKPRVLFIAPLILALVFILACGASATATPATGGTEPTATATGGTQPTATAPFVQGTPTPTTARLTFVG